MATGIQNQELMQGSQLKKQLAVAVRSIQWSYAIFWSISTEQHGVLEWTDGYYNGDIKTRKTMQPMELIVDKLGLKRSEQLKELYECLAIGEANEQAKRPAASLSPEDLSDAEWYYLVCMSFTFAPGIELPGKAFATGQHIWLSNAQYADSKIFTRSLLAKSASIQTVVCFPFSGGVIELGVADLVMEDINLLQYVKTIFLEFPKHICSEKSISSPQDDDNDGDPACEIDHGVVDTMLFEKFNPVEECGMQTELGDQIYGFTIPPFAPKEEFNVDQNGFKEVPKNVHEDLKDDSPSDSTDESETNQYTEDSFMMEGVNGGASQVQSWQFMDDDFSNCIPISMNSSDCISHTFFNPEKVIAKAPKKGIPNNVYLSNLQECNYTRFNSLDVGANDLHYTRTLSSILGNSNHLIAAPCSHNCNQQSSFAIWKKGTVVSPPKKQSCALQKMLKKILMEVPLMHGDGSMNSRKKNRAPEGEKNEKLTDPFLILRSLVPSISKVDKESILGDTINYLKDLERRVEELESRGRRKCTDIVERTCDNYCQDDTENCKKTPVNKRKGCDVDDIDPELEWVSLTDSVAEDVTVCIEEKEATIEMHVPWRECLLLQIMDAISNLQLDIHSVKSSTSDGILSLTLKSKFRGAGLVTAGNIKLAIQAVVATS